MLSIPLVERCEIVWSKDGKLEIHVNGELTVRLGHCKYVVGTIDKDGHVTRCGQDKLANQILGRPFLFTQESYDEPKSKKITKESD